ncbi:transport permease protein [Rhizocola hellebori]|uniref:Transport permease protein n=1 Tax=Rhizocola hellebori TaxID=1392758 RepID=A0A8J3Q2C9_9ACTN|nr:ABC transporter permease [Rhizocola hellebori]GIH02583.1 transport permease protein [Rhizocola hellebori]
MNPAMQAIRSGFRRGRMELRHTFTNGQDVMGYLVPPVILAVVMLFMRGATVPGTGFSLSARTLPGAVGMGIAFVGMAALAGMLVVEREDGTLLRAKAIPHGMTGYLIGKIVLVSGMTLIGIFLQLAPALLVLDGLTLTGPGAATMVWVFVLGMMATMPIGAMLGSLFSNPQNMGLIMLPLMGLIGISGIFYPITNFPIWLQWIAQTFPVYWLGLGTRSALLPGDMAAVEIGHSWRHLETAAVLGIWAAIGLVLAPFVLRRMARRESGSAVDARRQKAMQRVR